MAARVFTIAQQKGGVGKTTLAAHLAVAWSGSGSRVALIDSDPQGSLSAWYRERADHLGEDNTGLTFDVVEGWRVSIGIQGLARNHDIVLIDTPPHAEMDARAAIRAAELVIVPVLPSPMDVWATRPTLDLARQEKVPALLVLNRVPARVRLTDEVVARLSELDVEVAEARLGQRVGFAASLMHGRAIGEAAPTSPAAQEVAALAQEILDRAAR